MSAHISDELPRLLTGDASRDAVFDAAAHLRDCADCQQELVSAVVAHASITSAHRFAPEIVHTGPAAAEPAADTSLPDLSSMFAQVRTEAAVPERRRPHFSQRTALLAAAAVVVAGAGIGSYVAVQGGSSSAGQNVALTAFQTGSTTARAQIDGGRISVDASSLPTMAGKRYEVWLTNEQRTQMQPIGWIGADGKASMTVPTDLISRYSDIEVSVQPVASPGYQYSNISVLRGAYSD